MGNLKVVRSTGFGWLLVVGEGVNFLYGVGMKPEMRYRVRREGEGSQ